MPSYNPHLDPDNQAGVLADGFANAAAADPSIDDGSNGNIGVGNTATTNTNTNTTSDSNNDFLSNNTTDLSLSTTDVDTNVSDNGDNRGNSYDWEYSSKSTTETDIKTTDITTDVKVSDSFNPDSSVHDADIADLDNVSGIGNVAAAGGNLDFQLGDSYDFNLDINNVLNNSLNGGGNDAGFSISQVNNLADQDSASSITMDNSHANNQPQANAGDAFGADGLNIDSAAGGGFSGHSSFGHGSDDGATWSLDTAGNLAASSVADASASLTNSGIHMEIVQGANISYNNVVETVVGHDHSSIVTGDHSDVS
jgi:hypothetical protein